MSAPDTASQPGAGLGETQCTAALAHLERLQAQLDDMRLAIPRIIDPFHRPANPLTFKLYAQGVIDSQTGLRNLNQDWRSRETQNIFEHTKKSYAANPDLSACTSIPDYGWIEREQKNRKLQHGGQKVNIETNASLSDADIVRLIEDFKTAQTNVKVESQNDNRLMLISLISGSYRLAFRIRIEQEAVGKPKLNVECIGPNEPFLSITRCIASRLQANDLKHLLDMIAAYKTVKGTSCAKCGNLLDKAALIPTARRQKDAVATNDKPEESSWEALHESCLE